MTRRLLLPILTCGPLCLILAAWIKLYFGRHWPSALARLALGIVSANAALAAGTFFYYRWKPLPHFVPPWEDPEILQMGLLFLLAPIGMIVGIIAGARGAPKWLIAIVEMASVPLLLVGIMAGLAV